eukprot:9060800-Pyramimonas_sp.AAC.1
MVHPQRPIAGFLRAGAGRLEVRQHHGGHICQHEHACNEGSFLARVSGQHSQRRRCALATATSSGARAKEAPASEGKDNPALK